MENKKFQINHEFQTYNVEDLISLVKPIETGSQNIDSLAPEIYIEFPVLEAVKSFKRKGINTIFSSANIHNGAYIDIDYDSLNAKNKSVAQNLGKISEKNSHINTKTVKIEVPINNNTTVADIIMEYRKILMKFEDQIIS